MDKVQPITRRAALIGAVASSVAIAVPVATLMPTPAKAGVSPALQAAADEFEAAFIASVKADAAANDARRVKEEAIRDAQLHVRYSFDFPGGWERVDHVMPPYLHRKMLAKEFDEQLARARTRAAEAAADASPTAWATALWMPKEADILADRKVTMAAAKKVFRRYRRVELAHNDEPAWEASGLAYRRRSLATKALIAMALEGLTADEIAVVSRAFHRAGIETNKWFELPNNAFIAALAGDRERAEKWS